jgi:WD40 repeat protein
MSFAAGTIFISYSRSDGRDFAETFERRLQAEGIHAWRDLKEMGAGDIRPQVLRAIEGATQLVLILSRGALKSAWIKREWSHARLNGKRVSPVLADPTLTRADLPAWMRREEVFDIDPARDRDQERWKSLVLGLRGDGRAKRTPYMPGDLASNFVPRPEEYRPLKQAVLAEAPNRTVALTTALLGAGGYGKTTLANAICHDDDVRFEFSDGILRVEIGQGRNDVIALVADLIEKLDPEGKRPGFADIVTASEHLGELLGESRILLVIDDVWREAQLKPFLRGGPNCVRLVTTRLPGVLPAGSVPLAIDEMRAADAANLLGAWLPGAVEPASVVRLAALAKRLGYWAQMLAIANGWLRERVARGEPLLGAIAGFERRLKIDGPFVFDPRNETRRTKAIRICIEASMQDLAEDEASRFAELAVLPEDEGVPLAVVEALWAQTGRLDEDDSDDLVMRLDSLSLLQTLDLGNRTLRLHDNMLWYLRDKLGTKGLRAAHGLMVRAIHAQCGGAWNELPPDRTYFWRFVISHLRAAAQHQTADALLSDYAWIKARLHATDARSLYGSYFPESADAGVRQIGRAIGLSLPTLMQDKRALAHQMFGRLGDTNLPCSHAARLDTDCRPRPRWPGLTPPGAERLTLRGHEDGVESAAFSPDGTLIVTASLDCTARLWDAITGAEITALRGHKGSVQSAVFSPEGGRILTASRDRTARLWNATTGAEITTLRAHADEVHSAAFSPDGARIVTALSDRTARLWDAATSVEVATLRGHEGAVQNATFSFNGARIVTASSDRTARLWDAATGAEIAALRGHEGVVQSAVFSPDGKHILTTSWDHTARLWDAATGAEIAALRGHESWVESAAFSHDGTRIVTASDDRTVRLWDAATGAEITALNGHEDGVRGAAFSCDSTRIVTASLDRTVRLWDAAISTEIAALRGHENWVLSTAFSSDGSRIVTGSSDRTARLWDAATGAEVAVLRGHKDLVQSAAYSPNGTRIVTASSDRTVRLWDAAIGTEITDLRGHADEVKSVAFSPDGARIVTASWDRTARLWDAATGAEVAALLGHEHRVQSVAFSPKGARVVTASLDRTARIWDAASGAEIVALRGHEGVVGSAAFSPDGARVVTASSDRTARIWDAASGAEIVALRGHEDGVGSAAFSPDGARVVTASDDRTARIWDAASGAEIVALRGHEGVVGSAAFSPDSARVVTASDDRTARIWDAVTGAEIARMTVDAAISIVSIHGTAIAFGDALGRIHVFDAEDFLG